MVPAFKTQGIYDLEDIQKVYTYMTINIPKSSYFFIKK